jgi:multidrug efflux system membrane fusion protein
MAAHRKRLFWVLGALGLVAVAMVAWVVFHKKPAKPSKPPSVPVTTVTATAQDVPVSITALGAAQAWTSDTIFAQVSGKLIRVNFVEGSPVKAGQVLAEVDPGPYQAALGQQEGALERDQALLADARLDLARYQLLLKQDSIAKQQVDTQAALVKQDEGTVKIDQSNVAAAKINLGWCRIVSPINGRAGVRTVDLGNLVSASGSVSNTPSTASATNSSSAGSTATTSASTSGGGASGTGIVVINQLQPIAVTFTVPQGDFQRLEQVSDGFRRPLATRALSQETGAVLGSGELSIADNKVDPATGTVEMKARFPNPDSLLWPGQFVNVQLTLQTLQHVVTVPVAAVNRGPNGPFVYVVGPGNKAVVRPVAVLTTQGAVDVIKSGVQAGDVVVIDGQMTLKAGSLVKIKSAPPAGAPATPAPGTPAP